MKKKVFIGFAAALLAVTASGAALAAYADEDIILSEGMELSVTDHETANYSYSFDNCWVDVEDYYYPYTGSAVTPVVHVYDYELEQYLTEGTDYTVAPDADASLGVKTAVINGIGRYAGQSMDAEYCIDPADIESDSVVTVTDCVYTGSRVVPNVTVKYKGKTLTKDEDYTLDFYCDTWNIYDAGTYYVTINGKGNYSGSITEYYKITPKNASSATVTCPAQTYEGYACTPDPVVKIGGRTLTRYQDYDVTYSNNSKPGTATGKITFCGNYSGTKTFTFAINVGKPVITSVLQGEKTIKVFWDSVPAATGYQLYRYDSAKGAYVLVATTKNLAYANSGLNYATKYQFKVRAYYTSNGTNKYGAYSNIRTTYTRPPHTTINMATGEKTCLITWSKVSGIDGYEVLRYVNGSYKRYKLMGAGETRLYITGLSNDVDYRYAVRTYKKVGTATVYSTLTDVVGTQDGKSRFNGLIKGSASRTYKVYNVTGNTTTTSYRYISDSEWALVKKFASTHFKAGMSNYQKAMVAYDYIVNNTNYQYDYSKIQWDRPVYQVFVKHEAQCDGFNGAFVAVMRYLGYDMNLIQGTVNLANGTVGSHFWSTIKRGTQNYIFDTNMEIYWPGNTHYFFCAKYSDYNSYQRYIINKKSRTK